MQTVSAILIRKASATRDRLVFVTEALRRLLAEENFITLLQAEGLEKNSPAGRYLP